MTVRADDAQESIRIEGFVEDVGDPQGPISRARRSAQGLRLAAR
jgi:hypothetical protein